jgi:hypothetical protein
MSDQATEPFVRALAALLRDTDHEAVDHEGNISWSVLARQIPGMHYETLRKIKSGDRTLDADVIEQISAAVPVDPNYFVEYRLVKAREMFDPKVVGFDEAAKNLSAYLNGPAKSRAAKASTRPRTA